MKIRAVLLSIAALLAAGLFCYAAENDESMASDSEIIKIKGEKPKTAAPVSSTASAAPSKKLFTKIGVVESKEGEKLMLKRKTASLEYYVNNETKVFVKEQSSAKNIVQNNYILIKGPKNKSAILAGTVYIFQSKKDYDDYAAGAMQSDDEIKRFDLFTKSSVKLDTSGFDKVDEKLRPLLVDLGDGTKAIMAYDEDTYFVQVKAADQSALTAGERVTLYFADMINIRIKNYAFRVIINKAKPGY